MNISEIPGWIIAIHWASRAVLFFLVGLSIWSTATMIQCYRFLKKAKGGDSSSEIFLTLQKQLRESNFSDQLHKDGKSLYEVLIFEALSTKIQEPSRIDRVFRSSLATQKIKIERELTILATLGSNAPFIGLFGTVLGIIQAFGFLGMKQSSASLVMVGISEALIATAVGLFVAIPAVVAFNFFSRSLRVLISNCESIRDLYIAQMKE